MAGGRRRGEYVYGCTMSIQSGNEWPGPAERSATPATEVTRPRSSCSHSPFVALAAVHPVGLASWELDVSEAFVAARTEEYLRDSSGGSMTSCAGEQGLATRPLVSVS